MLISSKVAISISLAVALVGAASTAVTVEHQKTEQRREFTAKSLEAVELLALTVAASVAEHRHNEVQDALDNIANFPDRFRDVRLLEVIGEDGRVIASLDPTRFNEPAVAADADLKQLEAAARFEPTALRVVVPLVVTHRLGVLRATFDVASLDLSVQRQQQQAALSVLATSLLLGVSLHLLHGRLVARRLVRLADSAHKFGAGSMRERAAVDGNDEIGALGRSFNEMASALERHTEELEQLVAERTSELEQANAQLAALATTDQLTGLHNRRYFDDHGRRAVDVAQRSGRPLSLAIVDTDRFKSVNDRFGHPAGDEILKDVARVLRESARKSDLVARIGGEEYAILMPETDAAGALVVAERMRAALEDSKHPTVPELKDEKITASFGVATLGEGRERLEDLTAGADAALYVSKTTGRNRVSLAAPVAASEPAAKPQEEVHS
jgi:diguanylate cyclase (GGDEF)-like protein